MRTLSENHDLVVAGGGLSGFCAALAAARSGLDVALIQDRPVLGGNASSEVRVTVHGAACFHAYARESGIISEILSEERVRNHEVINENGWVNPVMDMVLYDFAVAEPNLHLHLNTSLVDVVLAGAISGLERTGERPPATDAAGYIERPACAEARRIEAVRCRIANAETELVLQAPLFADCTGDALLADLAGCAWRMGCEGRDEAGESHAPVRANRETMGNSIHIRCRDIGREAPFRAPDWAVKHEDPAYFYEQGRVPHDPRGGFWWIEIGIPWDTIHDNEAIRHELTRHALGIWDWMKNRDAKMIQKCRNYALDWIGQVPGKRESRRVHGLHWLTEPELAGRTRFADEVAFGGWFVDLHTPGGLLAPTSEPASAEGYRPDSEYQAKSYIGPYGIPLRSLVARDVDNLFLAGRNISSTHVALGTVRVMGTCALMGQAVGTAAAHAHGQGVDAHGSVALAPAIQQQLLADGCFLPSVAADIDAGATARASSVARLYGVGPDDTWHDGGIGYGDLAGRSRGLARIHSQFLHLSGPRLASIAICCDAEKAASVRLCLVRVESIWDYDLGHEPVAQAELPVALGAGQWLSWACNLDHLPAGCYRLDVGPVDGVGWQESTGFVPGCVAAFQMSPTRLRRLAGGIPLAFRLEPAQEPWSPDQVLSGVTRPQARANAWRSDPGQPLPQWVELSWPEARSFDHLQATFAGHLLREVHAEPPFHRDPQTVRDYRFQIPDSDGWRDLVVVRSNYHQRRRHQLTTAVTTDRLRLLIEATNGDPSATVYEVRAWCGAKAFWA